MYFLTLVMSSSFVCNRVYFLSSAAVFDVCCLVWHSCGFSPSFAIIFIAKTPIVLVILHWDNNNMDTIFMRTFLFIMMFLFYQRGFYVEWSVW